MSDTISWPPVACPTCDAELHRPCRDPQGRLEERVHEARTMDVFRPVIPRPAPAHTKAVIDYLVENLASR